MFNQYFKVKIHTQNILTEKIWFIFSSLSSIFDNDNNIDSTFNLNLQFRNSLDTYNGTDCDLKTNESAKEIDKNVDENVSIVNIQFASK